MTARASRALPTWGLALRLMLGAAALALLLPTPPAEAAETGTLRGDVQEMESGEPLEGVLITLTGDRLPGARTKTTDVRGAFWFPVLPPGEYRLSFSREGYQTIELAATVVLDQTVTLSGIRLPPFDLGVNVIEVIETLPVLDVTSSATVINVENEYFEKLPIGRTYLSTLRTLPGVSGRVNYETGQPSNGNASVRGEGQMGNNYLLEGFSIRDPVDKGWAISIPNEAIQELTVYTDGAPAEYGTFTGMVANILLKSGENETHGSIEYIHDRTLSPDATYDLYSPADGAVMSVSKRQRVYNYAIGTLGGAIVQDRLWYFNSVTLSQGWSTADNSDLRQQTPYNYQLASRFTFSPFDTGSTLLNVTILAQGTERSNYLNATTVSPEAQMDGITRGLNINANLKTLLSDLVIFEAKYNQWRSEFSAVPVSGEYITPSYTNIDTLQSYGNAPLGQIDSRTRQGLALHLTKYVMGQGGDHVLKGGYEWFTGLNTYETIWTGGPGTEGNPAYDYQVEGSNNDPYARTEHYNVGPLTHASSVHVFFAQDQWQPTPRLTVNIGARADHETLTQVDGRELVDAWVFSPRLGLAWDVLGDSRNLVTFNAGRYYDISSVDLARWGDTRSSDYYVTCPYNAETGGYGGGDLDGDGYPDDCIVQDPVAEPSVFTPEFRPYGVDKLTLGYQRAIFGQVSVGVKGIFSRTFNLSDDVNVNDHYWEIRNPTVIKRRDYKGLELTAKRRFLDNWQLLGSYTFSLARGTTPGQSEGGSAGNDVGVYLDNPADPFIRNYYNWLGPLFGYNIYNGLGYDSYDGFGNTYPGNPEGWYGYLPYHSFHQFKLNGSYETEWGTNVGLVYELDSGHAYERSGFLLFYDYSTYPEGRGARHTPAVHYIDLSVSQTLALKEERSLELELNVFNVFNFEQPISFFTNFNQESDYYASLGLIDEAEANPGFDAPYFRQSPRSIQASARFRF